MKNIVWRSGVMLLIVLNLSFILVYRDFTDKNSIPSASRRIWFDDYSEQDAYWAGKNFAKDGFLKSKMLPNLTGSPEKNGYYVDTHYPALPHILYGLYLKMGISKLGLIRLVPIVLALISVFLIYYLLSMYFGPKIAITGSLLYSIHPVFLDNADHLHQSMYAWFLLLLTMILTTQIFKGTRKQNLILWLNFLVLVLLANVTFEYIINILLVTVGLYYYHKHYKTLKANRLHLCVLLAGPLFGFLLHFLQNALFFDSFIAAFQDLKKAFLSRTLNEGGGVDTYIFLTSPNEYLSYLGGLAARHYHLTFGFTVAGLLTIRLLVKEWRRYLALIFILLVGSITWWVIFRQHTFIHKHVDYRHLLFFAVAFFATVITALLEKCVEQFKKKSWWRATVSMFLLCMFIVPPIYSYYNYLVPIYRFRNQPKYLITGNQALNYKSIAYSSNFSYNNMSDPYSPVDGIVDNGNGYWYPTDDKESIYWYEIHLKKVVRVNNIKLLVPSREGLDRGKFTPRDYAIFIREGDGNEWQPVVKVEDYQYPNAYAGFVARRENGLCYLEHPIPISNITDVRVEVYSTFSGQNGPRINEIEIYKF